MKISATLVLLIIVCSCTNQQKVDTKAEGEKLMQLSREWSKAASTDSIDKILGYWADDAVVMPPGDAAIKGKEGIRAMVEGAAKMPGFKISWEPISVSVSESGDMAYMIEKTQITFNDSTGHPMTQLNKGVTIWKKQADGSWKNVVDTWNAEPPPPELR